MSPTLITGKLIPLLSAIGLSLIIFSAAIITEKIAANKMIPKEIARKIFHLIAGVSAAFSIKFIDDKSILIAFGSLATVVSFALVYFNIFQSFHRSSGKSWGIFFLPLSYTLLVITLFPANGDMIFISMLIFAFSDSFSAIGGSTLSKSFYWLTSDKKSVVGSSIFFVITTLLVFAYFHFGTYPATLSILPNSIIDNLVISIAIALVLTITEAMSSKGFDNLTVPIFGAIIIYVLQYSTQEGLAGQFVLGVFLSALVALVSIRFKFLTLNGSTATFILAAFIFGFGGWKWAIPIMAFFILSSLLSKIRKKANESIDTYFEKTGTRDYLQVLANGGIGGLLVIFNQIFPSEVNYYIYLASLSAVCADTWATEIGTLRKRVTYNILNLKRIDQGVSGGISIVGTIGAALGSFVIALSGIAWIDLNLVTYLLLIVTAGLFGSFFDSLLGATVQAQGKCRICDKVTEKHIHCGEGTKHFRGIKWLNNDAVNFLAGLFSSAFILLINYIN